MSNLILNLGLGNNPHTVEQCVKIVTNEIGVPFTYALRTSQWDGQPERTLVLDNLGADDGLDLWSWELVEALRRICVLCTQDCIAAKYDGIGVVINKTAPDTVIFDEQYFVN